MILVRVSIFLTLVAIGCTSETAKNKELLLGRWEVVGATRSNKPTDMVNGAFMDFSKQGKWSTNLTGDTISASYEVKKNVLSQTSSLKGTFIITEIDNKRMLLESNLMESNFTFELNKLNN
jgi:hypothetical protein